MTTLSRAVVFQHGNYPPKLICLKLNTNSITCEALSQLDYPTGLKLLDLSYNPISQDRFGELKFPPSLICLKMVNNHINDEELSRFNFPVPI